MYGIKGNYFSQKNDNFINTTWIELIGFERTSPDYGVGDYINKLGFVPDCVSYHLTSIDFVNDFQGLEQEYELPIFACSYFGHTHNDDRERQPWTNHDLLGLTKELQARGIKVYASFFDLEAEPGLPGKVSFATRHPELRGVDRTGTEQPFIFMLKRFADKSSYGEYLLEKLLQVVTGYGWDGIQLADGISSPRLSLQEIDFSDDMFEQFLTDTGITPPAEVPLVCCEKEDFEKRANWIVNEQYIRWVNFHTKKWSAFMGSLIKGLRSIGKDAAFNSAWTKDPVESIYRYGTDYKKYVEYGATSFVVEDVASDLEFLAEEDTSYLMDYAYRKFIHYEFAAALMTNKALLPGTPLTPLFMIRDTLEQWDTLHHQPAAMQRAAGSNLNKYIRTKDGKLVPITSGPYFCLADGLTKEEWDHVRITWDNGYTKNPVKVHGYTVVWSDKAMYKEVQELCSNKTWHTAKWIAELTSRKVAVNEIAPIENLDKVEGPILVINSYLFDSEELMKINNYDKGNVFFIGLQSDKSYELKMSEKGNKSITLARTTLSNPPDSKFDPCGAIWTHPLNFRTVDESFVKECVEQLLEYSKDIPHAITTMASCNVMSVETGPDTVRIFVENDEYYYILPWIETNRKIKRIDIITKPKGYPVRVEGSKFKVRVPGRGMDIVEIEFEN